MAHLADLTPDHIRGKSIEMAEKFDRAVNGAESTKYTELRTIKHY